MQPAGLSARQHLCQCGRGALQLLLHLCWFSAHRSCSPPPPCANPAHVRPSLRISVSGKIRVHWPFLLMLTVGLSVVKESLFSALRSNSL